MIYSNTTNYGSVADITLISLILFKIWIGVQIRRRNRENVEVGTEIDSGLLATFPFPVVSCVTTKLIKSNKVSSSVTFQEELTNSFVENVIEGH